MTLEKVSPNLPNITTFSCGSCVIENAFKAMMIAYQMEERGDQGISEDDIDCALKNQPPGSPNLAILTFKNAHHGHTMGALSASSSNGLAKLDIPAFHWPQANFPKYKYPLEQFLCYNTNQDREMFGDG
ncbi:hypothetical protein NQ314_008758 [Rhamnusium bicolor]|uniref:Uncharacterized protein n=1 Tax=Rhamnusium bicolor TaxID=1586634 RepID=A0AAV8Y735_9CUCU|nr:hypothetical protein NQ314_008758 [Rhamnusium bicolor]